MRRLLLPITTLALASCAPAATSALPVESPVIDLEVKRAERDAQVVGDVLPLPLVGDLTGGPDEGLPSKQLVDPNNYESFGSDDLPNLDGHAPEPLAPLVPTRPTTADDPLELAVWAGTILLNYGPTIHLNADELEPFMAPALISELTDSRTPTVSSANTSRGILLDANLTTDTASDSLLSGVAIFERTIDTNPESEIVILDFLAHHTDQGWQIIELQIST